MATIKIERGEKSYSCWQFLQRNSSPFVSYRLYGTEPPEYYKEWLAFDIDDERIAVELALRFAS